MDTRKRECSPWPQGHDHLVMENDTSTQIKLPKRGNGGEVISSGGIRKDFKNLGGEGGAFGMDLEEQ